MSFADQVKMAVADAENAADTEPARRYRAVLDELASGLGQLGAGARLLGGQDPRKLALYLHAPYRPQRGSPMLAFFFDGEDVVVSGENPTRIRTPEELERWLLQFVKLPAFVESLRMLREEANLPVEARLRVDAQVAYAKGDVVVVVSPADQKMIAEAEAGAAVELEVERVEFPGNAQFADPPRYAVLESAGIFVDVERAEHAGDKLRIRGVRAAQTW